MKERLLNIWNTIKEKLSALSSKTKRLIIGGLVLCIALSVGVALWLNNRPYEVLFSGLSSDEAREIMTKLQTDGVDYKYQNDGTILVPEKQEESLKAQLVYEGYPNSGFTYNIFSDNVSMTSTESEKAHYELLNLQERMGATIALFPNVKEARVTITLGEDNRYVLSDRSLTEASASATVVTKDGSLLEPSAVKAIQRLMSKSIQGVDFENVAVICNGQDVTVEEENESQSFSSQLKLSLEREFERKLTNQISTILEPIYGEGHYKVSVKSDINIDKTLREIINYSAEDPEDNTGVISSENAGWEINREDAQPGGVPGTETNADIPVYTRITTDGTENYIGADGSINYLVDQLKEQTEVLSHNLRDISIAVVIDGNNLGGVQRNELISLIARAAGIDPLVQNDKIEVVNAPFYTEPVAEEPENNGIIGSLTRTQLIIIAAIVGVLLLILILVIVLLVRRKKKKRRLEEEERQRLLEEEELQNALGFAAMAPTDGNVDGSQDENGNPEEDILNLRNERGMELKKKIRGFAEENPEISAQLLKQWLNGGVDRVG